VAQCIRAHRRTPRRWVPEGSIGKSAERCACARQRRTKKTGEAWTGLPPQVQRRVRFAEWATHAV
jgi:hypothetical protein